MAREDSWIAIRIVSNKLDDNDEFYLQERVENFLAKEELRRAYRHLRKYKRKGVDARIAEATMHVQECQGRRDHHLDEYTRIEGICGGLREQLDGLVNNYRFERTIVLSRVDDVRAMWRAWALVPIATVFRYRLGLSVKDEEAVEIRKAATFLGFPLPNANHPNEPVEITVGAEYNGGHELINGGHEELVEGARQGSWIAIRIMSNKLEGNKRLYLEERVDYFLAKEELRRAVCRLRKAERKGVLAEIVEATRNAKEIEGFRDHHHEEYMRIQGFCDNLQERLRVLVNNYNFGRTIIVSRTDDMKAMGKAWELVPVGTVFRYRLGLSVRIEELVEIRQIATSFGFRLPNANVRNEVVAMMVGAEYNGEHVEGQEEVHEQDEGGDGEEAGDDN